MLKIAINGGGRIGRACARMLLLREDVHLVAIADPMPARQLHYLLKYDSVHGILPLPTQYVDDRFLCGGRETQLLHASIDHPTDLAALGADVALECSGRFLKAADHQKNLQGGIKRVVLSAMPEDDSAVVLPGLGPVTGGLVVSAGSCTTNALALLSAALEARFKIKGILATSIHSYTSDQRLLDGSASGERRRGRAADLNIIPTTTMAAHNLSRLLGGKVAPSSAIGLRVPLPNVCMMQAVFALSDQVDRAVVLEAVQQFSDRLPPNILTLSQESKVSSDMIGRPQSAVVDGPLTLCSGNLVQLCAWHDNESGYASRVIDLALQDI